MKVAELASKRPVTIFMLLLVIVFLGFVSFTHLKLDLLPHFEYPFAVVVATYMGAGAEEVEQLVTKPLEEYIATTPGVRRFTSTTMDSFTFIFVEFEWNVNPSEAVGRLSRYVGLAKQFLPEKVNPVVVEFDPSILPVYAFSTKDYQKVLNEIRRLPDVASVDLMGAPSKVVRVLLDDEKIKALDVDPSLIETILSGNLVYPFGQVKDEQGNVYTVSLDGKFESIADLKRTIVGFRGVKYQSIARGEVPKLLVPVRLENIASVEIVEENPKGEIRVNGEKGTIVAIYKRSGANTVQVVRAVKKLLQRSGIDYVEVVNQAYYTERAIVNLLKNLILGFLAATLVVYLFLNDVTSTLVTSFSIPLSLTTTFVLLYLFGINLDTLTLGGLIMALGMLVDNSIVVFENIYRHRMLGEDISTAAREGTREVWYAILASTLTTVAVFLPIVFLSGFVVRLFRYFVLSFVLALSSSLFVATVMIPAATKWIKPKERPWMRKLQEFYASALEKCLSRRGLVLTVSLVLVAFSVCYLASKPLGFLPEFQTNLMVIEVRMPPQASYEMTSQAVQEIEKYLLKNKQRFNILSFYSDIGITSVYSQILGKDQNVARIMVNLGGKRQEFSKNKEILRREIEAMKIPNASVEVLQQSQQIYEVLGYPITVVLKGEDLDELQRRAFEVAEKLSALKGVVRVAVRNTYEKEVLKVKIDRNKALMSGSVPGQVFLDLQAYLLGKELGTVKTPEGVLPIVLRRAGELTVDDLPKLQVSSLMSVTLLGAISRMEKKNIPSIISHENGERVMYVDVQVVKGSIGEVTSRVEETLKGMELGSVGFELTGQKQYMDEALSDLVYMLVVAVLLVYMILAAQFESFTLPFVIFTTVPLSLFGVALAMIVRGYSLDVPVLVALITLVGTVVNNAIVMLTRVEDILREKPLREAVLEGAKSRLRPILMTTLTTVIALVPTALTRGEGAEIEAPISWVVIMGLLISTFFTLFVVPIVYELIRERIRV